MGKTVDRILEEQSVAFESLSELFSMCYTAPIGDIRCHGGYVWSAYGIAALIFLANMVAPVLRRKQVTQTIRRKLKREQASL